VDEVGLTEVAMVEDVVLELTEFSVDDNVDVVLSVVEVEDVELVVVGFVVVDDDVVDDVVDVDVDVDVDDVVLVGFAVDVVVDVDVVDDDVDVVGFAVDVVVDVDVDDVVEVVLDAVAPKLTPRSNIAASSEFFMASTASIYSPFDPKIRTLRGYTYGVLPGSH